jgi:hypothetical protein
MRTFRELYCERRGISADRFEHELVYRSLHWQARPVYWLLGLNREYTSPDYEFVRSVGDLRRWKEYREEAIEYHYHPRNRGFLRTALRLRVSAQRLKDILDREFKDLIS